MTAHPIGMKMKFSIPTYNWSIPRNAALRAGCLVARRELNITCSLGATPTLIDDLLQKYFLNLLYSAFVAKKIALHLAFWTGNIIQLSNNKVNMSACRRA
jgi:hypothetical protein